MNNRRPVATGQLVITAMAVLFFGACTGASAMRWANFEYRTFDLAYYVQAVWQLIHGSLEVSVEHVPLLGNHVEPIVFLIAPLFALFRHPLLFVIVQNAALATMGPVGFAIAKRRGFDDLRACLLGAALLLAPATAYIALHEFHPEALTAPFLLLMLHARVARALGKHWLWFLAVLACKENMALLLAAYCIVHCLLERDRPKAELFRWYVYPLGVAVLWFLLCSLVITPAFNSGQIDYLTLYDRLGSSPREILTNAIIHPQRIGHALWQSLTHGNLLWALLLPFLGLPLLRPRWIIISAPILLQHLLSWRSSEWTIYFHYAAPLLPLFWFAAVEAIALSALWKKIPGAVVHGIPALLLIACAFTQAWLGPAPRIAAEVADWSTGRANRARKNAFIKQIPADASLVAPLPYLSHLAMREKLYSLHYILKGLRTLSHTTYETPPPTDYVLIDYNDTATFDAGAGYYHPQMQTKDGRVIPSSDRLLHDFLRRSGWTSESQDELTLLHRYDRVVVAGTGSEIPEDQVIGFEMNGNQILKIQKLGDRSSRAEPLDIRLLSRFEDEREVFPWLLLRLSNAERSVVITKGLWAPEVGIAPHSETWRVTAVESLPDGDFSVEALLIDNGKRAWYEATGGGGVETVLLCPPVPLGRISIKH